MTLQDFKIAYELDAIDLHETSTDRLMATQQADGLNIVTRPIDEFDVKAPIFVYLATDESGDPKVFVLSNKSGLGAHVATL